MLNLKCKRYLEAEGRRCGCSAERRYARKQCVGTFCFPCWIEVMETLPLKIFFGWTPTPGSPAEAKAREMVRADIGRLREQWIKVVEKYEAEQNIAG